MWWYLHQSQKINPVMEYNSHRCKECCNDIWTYKNWRKWNVMLNMLNYLLKLAVMWLKYCRTVRLRWHERRRASSSNQIKHKWLVNVWDGSDLPDGGHWSWDALINRVSVLWWDWHCLRGRENQSAWHMLGNTDHNSGSAFDECVYMRLSVTASTLNSHPYAERDA